MATATPSAAQGSTEAALEAFRRGFVPLPIRAGSKRPSGGAWPHTRYADEDEVRAVFDAAEQSGSPGMGLLLGEPSGGLVDVDLDHPKALRLRDFFLPPTSMQTGRPGRPRSHRWYIVKDNLPATRPYRLPDPGDGKRGAMLVELRSTGAQTLVPPTIHPEGEPYRWENAPWGGKTGPAVVDGRKLAVQVALLGMGSVLLEFWPQKGGRHDAYLALAGGLLRFGDGVHPYWERNLPVLIGALADASRDEDGAEQRVSETMGSTLTRLREGGRAIGFPKLAEMIGTDPAEQVRRWARDVEALAGFVGTPIRRMDATLTDDPAGDDVGIVSRPPRKAGPGYDDEALVSTLPPVDRNPMEERVSSWGAVDLGPYLSGQVVMPEPCVLTRSDGLSLFYPGRVNSLFGMSESAKTFVSLFALRQQLDKGERVMMIDLEDDPTGALSRLMQLGAGADDLERSFRYVHPEGPLADMQRYRYGANATDDGRANSSVFWALMDSFDPTLVVVDGMTVLYGLHGHDTNDATGTDVVIGWLKRVARAGRTTVIVIDHTGKGGGPGSSPIGAHHKVAMVQGTALRVDVIERPMPGSVGSMRLIVFKDRPGSVRKISTQASEQVAGIVTIDSTEEGVIRMRVDPPDPDDVVVADSAAMERELEKLSRIESQRAAILEMFGGDLDAKVTTKMVHEKYGWEMPEIRSVWELLVKMEKVQKFGASTGTHYRLVR